VQGLIQEAGNLPDLASTQQEPQSPHPTGAFRLRQPKDSSDESVFGGEGQQT